MLLNSSVGERPAPRGEATRPDDRKIQQDNVVILCYSTHKKSLLVLMEQALFMN